MSGVREVPYSIADATARPAKKPSKKRKKRSGSASATDAAQPPSSGWKKVELDDLQIEGFDDGCAYDFEELTGEKALLP